MGLSVENSPERSSNQGGVANAASFRQNIRINLFGHFKKHPIKRHWNRCPRWLRIAVLSVTTMTILLLAVMSYGYWYLNSTVDRTDGVVYGSWLQKHLSARQDDVVHAT